MEHKITGYKSTGKYVTYFQQQNELPALKHQFPEFKNVYSQVLQNVLKRLDNSFIHFFNRVKKGETPGFPRFKGSNRFNSICYPQDGFKIIGNKVYVSKTGLIKIKMHRNIIGTVKTCSIKTSGDKWYMIFTAQQDIVIQKKPVINAVGIDLGIESFSALSDGSKIENPRHLRKSEQKLKAIQSKYCKHKGNKTKKKLSALHRKIRNQRNDFLHKQSRILVGKYELIAYEDLNIRGMAQGRFAKSIHDAGWGNFIDMIKYKAESAGIYTIAVNPRNTSQMCSGCGTIVKKEIHQRQHDCPVCGLSLHRDLNASINILKSGTDLWNKKLIPEVAVLSCSNSSPMLMNRL